MDSSGYKGGFEMIGQYRSPFEYQNRRLIYRRSAQKAPASIVTLRSQRQ
jgi:hypothetical protein